MVEGVIFFTGLMMIRATMSLTKIHQLVETFSA